ncbi:MAG: Ribonucleotide reductase of class Ia (aerobic), alpha subunit, partial [uncultured Thermomicrobiales bacterium]
PGLLLQSHAVQRRDAPCAVVILLPDLGSGRSRQHLQERPRQRAALEVEWRSRQRLDQRACARQPDQGHQRREPGGDPLPQGRQRRRRRRQPGRQAQGRRLHLPRGLAQRHRRVPRPAQEHRRRSPPRPRHEHRRLDPRSVHGACRAGRKLDAVQPERRARPPRPLRGGIQAALRGIRGAGREGGDSEGANNPRDRPLAQDAQLAVRDRPPVDHLQGSLERPQPAGPCRRRPQLQSLHRDPAQHQPRGGRGLQPGLDQPAGAHEGWRARSRHDRRDRHDRDPDARQRDRHQLLPDPGGGSLQPPEPPDRARPDGIPGRPVAPRGFLRLGRGDGLRRPLDGADLLARADGVVPARRRARRLPDVRGLEVGSRVAADRHRRCPCRRARPGDRRRDGRGARLGAGAGLDPRARHAQQQHDGDRADRDDLQHPGRRAVDRADLQQSLCQEQPLRRVHDRQRVAGGRVGGTRALGRRPARRDQVLGRLDRGDLPDPGRHQAPLP